MGTDLLDAKSPTVCLFGARPEAARRLYDKQSRLRLRVAIGDVHLFILRLLALACGCFDPASLSGLAGAIPFVSAGRLFAATGGGCPTPVDTSVIDQFEK